MSLKEFVRRARNFLGRPPRDQWHLTAHWIPRFIRTGLKAVWAKVLPPVPLPMRLQEGAWWLAANDWVGNDIFRRVFELPERHFVQRYLKPGMTVLDIGAHHGLYSVLAALRVGNTGRVISFEPSPRERERLRLHIRINGLSNIEPVALAVGRSPGSATLYLPGRKHSGFNSLRPIGGSSATERKVDVDVTTLDDFLDSKSPATVDFIKMDVEGGERDVLLGAERMLAARPRPVILCEVDDQRTKAWGYEAQEILDHLEHRGFEWFTPIYGGTLRSIAREDEWSGINLVAVPEERRDELSPLIQEDDHGIR